MPVCTWVVRSSDDGIDDNGISDDDMDDDVSDDWDFDNNVGCGLAKGRNVIFNEKTTNLFSINIWQLPIGSRCQRQTMIGWTFRLSSSIRLLEPTAKPNASKDIIESAEGPRKVENLSPVSTFRGSHLAIVVVASTDTEFLQEHVYIDLSPRYKVLRT